MADRSQGIAVSCSNGEALVRPINSAAGKGVTTPNRFIVLLYLGVVSLALGVLALGIGLLTT